MKVDSWCERWFPGRAEAVASVEKTSWVPIRSETQAGNSDWFCAGRLGIT